MSITVIQGRPGMGKTVYLVGKIIDLISVGYDVYTNIGVQLPPWDKRNKYLHSIDSLEDIIQLRSGKIVLDEVQTYLNSRNWDKLDIKFQLLLQQHRKRGLDIIGATQSIKRADIVFRELVHYFYDIQKITTFRIPFTKIAFGFFLIRQYDPDSIESGTGNYQKIGWTSLFVADPFVLQVYDTTQEYVIESPIGKRVIEEYVYVEKPTITKHMLSTTKVENIS